MDDPWQYSYLITGQKKIGKTSFAIQGSEELVIQFDKPQISYSIREVVPKSWKEFERALRALEKKVEEDDFPYNRIVVDGCGEWYQMCQLNACDHFKVDHPSEVGYAKCWHKIRDDFLDAVNRLHRLQVTAECGLMFIAHAEWKETKTRFGNTVEKMVPALPPKAEAIIGGKVDGWFVYDYAGEERVLTVLGDETMGAGHRIDNRFETTDGRRIREVTMGSSAEEALANFVAAFRNEQDYATYKELRNRNKKKEVAGRKKKGARKSRKSRAR